MSGLSVGVGIDCDKCGLGTGSADHNGNIRCDDCGQFAETTDMYCAKHDVDLRRLPAGYDGCPQCQEEMRVNAAEHEMMARRADPKMHNTVDSKRF